MTFSTLITEDQTIKTGKPMFRLVEPLVAANSPLGRLVVPIGFVTDLASIPRVLWNVLPPIGGYDRAAVVHDFLYQLGTCNRAEADEVLKAGMKALQVGNRTTQMIYWGVRLGGWKPWRAYREAR